jgi:hypothetical protein
LRNERIALGQTEHDPAREYFAIAGRKSDEVEWLIAANQIKSMWTVLDHSRDCRGSHAGCNRLVFAGDTPATTDHRLVIFRPKNDMRM